MDPSFTYTVGDLARDQRVGLRCACRARTYGRADLIALAGRDARLHLVGPHRVLWCGECGEPPFTGRVASAVPGRPQEPGIHRSRPARGRPLPRAGPRRGSGRHEPRSIGL